MALKGGGKRNSQTLVVARLRRAGAHPNEFVQFAVEGDGEALAALLDGCESAIRNRIRHGLGSRAGDDRLSEAVWSASRENILKGIRTFEGRNGAGICTWMGAVAGNAAVDARRAVQGRERKERPMSDVIESLPGRRADQRGIGTQLEANEIFDLVADNLTPQHWEIFELRHLHEWSWDRIAEKYGTKESTLRSRYNKDMGRVRRILRRQGLGGSV